MPAIASMTFGGAKPPAPPKPGIPAKGPKGTATLMTAPGGQRPGTASLVFPSLGAGPKPAAPKQVAPTPVTPGASPAAPASAATEQASPLDSTYFGNLAANQFKVGNQINAWNAQSGNYNTALQSALAQLAYQQPRDQLKTEQAANRRGALYSSVYNQDLGNLNNTYQTKQSGLVETNAQRQAALASQIAAAQQGEGIYQSQQYDDAVARATKAAAANPATGQPAIPTPTPTPAAPGAPATTTGMNPNTVLAGRPTAQPRSSRQQLAQKIATMSFSGLGKGRR